VSAPASRLCAACAQLAERLPADWRSSARRRRFLHLTLCSPGFVGIAALPAHKSIAVLLASFASLAAALAFRRFSEPALSAASGPGLGDIVQTGGSDV